MNNQCLRAFTHPPKFKYRILVFDFAFAFVAGVVFGLVVDFVYMSFVPADL
jgi:hypothetical protein